MSATNQTASSKCRAGFGKQIITPSRGFPLRGYFNRRYNTGVLDDLHVRALVLETNDSLAGIISLDICLVTGEMTDAIDHALRENGLPGAEHFIVCGTHTHTGPHVSPNVAGAEACETYLRTMAQATAYAVKQAQANLHPSTFACGTTVNNPFAFNRRYYMKNGLVVTNPGKLNPDIDRPEGTVDREIGVLTIEQDGDVAGVLVNVVNHTDTIGGDKVSADWPAQLERTVQEHIGAGVPVITLVGCSGNINHFDVTSEDPQTDYDEAKRIGCGYGRIVCRHLPKLKPLAGYHVRTLSTTAKLGYRQVTEKQLQEARSTLGLEEAEPPKRLTSEELAKGDIATLKFFAKELIEFAERTRGRPNREARLTCIRLSDEVALTCLPGEPFTEVGMQIKSASPFRTTFVISNSNRSCGYIPMPECFGRGGYETRVTVVGGAREDSAEILIRESVNLLQSF